MTSLLESPSAFQGVTPCRLAVGSVAGGIGACWPQFRVRV
jgi:hypothetical protein